MRYALIGCGRISTNHVKAVLNNQLEFVAACDIIQEQITELLKKHHGITAKRDGTETLGGLCRGEQGLLPLPILRQAGAAGGL